MPVVIPNENDPIQALELRLSEHRIAVLSCVMENYPIMVGDMRIISNVQRFMQRVDNNGLMLPEYELFDAPPTLHACIHVAVGFIYQTNIEGIGYESEAITPFQPKPVIQSIAARYNVDPSEMVAQYPEARRWVSHKEMQHPANFDALLNKIKLQTKRRVN